MIRLTLCIAFAMAVAGVAVAQCEVAAAKPCVIDLHGEGSPRQAPSCAGDAWKGHLGFELPLAFADADRNGWHEVVLRLDVDPRRGCGCAVFRITFEGDPSGFSVNIGDSPTNDGRGGDDWSTRFDAELEIVRRDLTAYGSERPGAPADLQIFGMRDLPITDAVLELEICDQAVRYAIDPRGKERGLSGFFNTYHARDLIAIRPSGDTPSEGEAPPDSRIYAAFNRVIHRRAGAPAQGRFGAGVRRVEVALTP